MHSKQKACKQVMANSLNPPEESAPESTCWHKAAGSSHDLFRSALHQARLISGGGVCVCLLRKGHVDDVACRHAERDGECDFGTSAGVSLERCAKLDVRLGMPWRFV